MSESPLYLLGPSPPGSWSRSHHGMPPSPRLPFEVCERVIECVLLEHRRGGLPETLKTLSFCALVCRAWRPCAQRVLFRHVVLRDVNAFHRFAALLDVSPALGDHVWTLGMWGNFCVPDSVAVQCPIVLGTRLAGLVSLSIVDLVPYGRRTTEPSAELEPHPARKKTDTTLSCWPIHPYFSSALKSISHIRELNLQNVRLSSFVCAGIVGRPRSGAAMHDPGEKFALL
ncbi:hypothetical protein L226DRAFT_35240 [Lentinus tigrinus ALCF2SS1-7]|uniref:uncharacterized protein n=1 Tax=Lentinus tigrinus ALCF2SS1-7 TaxID=1328758 RepID=UPI001165CADB|nr:hypothetical protein L226DRAFT_35240 [Lentinus tigrinus ALCF2SS1-7]